MATTQVTARPLSGPAKYGKLIVSLVGAAVSAGTALGINSGHLSWTAAINIMIAVVAAFQVWYVTETRDNPSGKAVIAAVAAALIAVQSVFSAGVHAPSLTEWVQVAVAALSAAGILVTPGNLKAVE